MSFDYASLQQTATELIQEFGILMLLKKPESGGVYDPVTDETTPGIEGGDHEVFGVKIAPTEEYTQSIGAGNVQSRDMLVYLESKVKPDLVDELEIDGEIWQIVNVQNIKPAAVSLLYILQVRP